jgi:hypothetical protein
VNAREIAGFEPQGAFSALLRAFGGGADNIRRSAVKAIGGMDDLARQACLAGGAIIGGSEFRANSLRFDRHENSICLFSVFKIYPKQKADARK